MEDALQRSGISADRDWEGRVDLILSSGTQLLVLEFMRPGLTVDRNHIDRFQRYVEILRTRAGTNRDLRFRDITGLLVADKLHRNPEDQKAIDRVAADGMHCSEWEVLLDKAEAQWTDFLFALVARAPDDDRVRALTVSELQTTDGVAETDSAQPEPDGGVGTDGTHASPS